MNIRNCPECKKELIYKSERYKNIADGLNRSCRTCCRLKISNELTVICNEIKPKYLFETPIVIAKKLAAEKWCSDRGYSYEMIDPGSYRLYEVRDLHEKGIITLQTKRHLSHTKALKI